MKYFRWQHNLLHARPLRKFFLLWEKQLGKAPYKLLYHSRRLLYFFPRNDDLEMLNLEAGEDRP